MARERGLSPALIEKDYWVTHTLWALRQFVRELSPRFRPFVLLEVGTARVTPFVPRPLSSFVHDALERRGQLSPYDDNRPRDVRCVHPLVTLLEKLDAIVRRFPRDELRPEESLARPVTGRRALRGTAAEPGAGGKLWLACSSS